MSTYEKNRHLRVSIIVPVYKVPEKYLRKCIESCMGQSLRDIEIILVADYDEEPDGCTAICDEYAQTDGRVKVIKGKKNGLSAARNKGFLEAGGEWIMFVDGDDWIDSDMCSGMLKKAENEKVQIVLCGYSKDYSHSSFEYEICLDEDRRYSGDEDCAWLHQQILQYNSNMATAYAKLIHRQFLLDNNILHDAELRRGSEGIEFNVRLFEKIESAAFIKKSFYHYVFNDESFSQVPDESTHKYVLMSFEKIRNSIAVSKHREVLEPLFYNRLLYITVTTAISGYFNPENREPFKTRKEKFKNFMSNPMIAEAMAKYNCKDISAARRIVLFLIRTRGYRLLDIMGKIRRWQKEHR